MLSTLEVLFSCIVYFMTLSIVYGQLCPNNCNNLGVCDKFGRCTCNEGFMGGDCSLRYCPMNYAWNDSPTGTDKAHALAECSNRGTCDRQLGACECMDGFTGHACERLSCEAQCNGAGKCVSMHDYATRYRNQKSIQYTYNNVWDAKKLDGCICDVEFSGYDCTVKVCPNGDDPLTKGQFNEVQIVQCVAVSGNFVLYFGGYPSANIPYTATVQQVRAALLAIPVLTGITVTYSIPTAKACQTSINAIIIEFTDQFGPQPPLVAMPDVAMAGSGGTVLVVADGVSSVTDSNGVVFLSVKGTKEDDACANRGVCSKTDGTCSCYTSNGDVYASSDGYGNAGTRGDCGYIYSGYAVATCPGDVQCSGNGLCDEKTFRCTCTNGYTSGDCAERICPKGPSWFEYPTANEQAHLTFATYTECSNMGTCDPATGRCICRNGFFGEACQYMACGGGLSSPCNGHGRCMTMSELALWSTDNGASTTYTYGADPNNFLTWDGDRIHGCLCDEGYEGYDCSLRSCPRGDDAATYNQHDEVQLLYCIADGGTFKLTFREHTTAPIPYNATMTALRDALQALPSILQLRVYFTLNALPPNDTLHIVYPTETLPQGFPQWAKWNKMQSTLPIVPANIPKERVLDNSTLCTLNGQQLAIIYFESVHGPLPPLLVDKSKLVLGGLVGGGVVNTFFDGEMGIGTDNLGVTHPFTSVSGTTENDVCNNRGICDHELGVCNCFPTWSSSDGKRGPGLLGDCGYRNTHLYTDFDSFRINS